MSERKTSFVPVDKHTLRDLDPQLIAAAIDLYSDGISPARLGLLLGKSKEWVRLKLTPHTLIRPKGRPTTRQPRTLNGLPDHLRTSYVSVAGYSRAHTDITLAALAESLELTAMSLRGALIDDGGRLRHRESRRSRNASQLVNQAIRQGKLVRGACECCQLPPFDPHTGRAAVIGHHNDYNKPLEVRWLCPACHAKWHQEHDAVMEGESRAQRSPESSEGAAND